MLPPIATGMGTYCVGVAWRTYSNGCEGCAGKGYRSLDREGFLTLRNITLGGKNFRKLLTQLALADNGTKTLPDGRRAVEGRIRLVGGATTEPQLAWSSVPLIKTAIRTLRHVSQAPGSAAPSILTRLVIGFPFSVLLFLIFCGLCPSEKTACSDPAAAAASSFSLACFSQAIQRVVQ